MPIDFKNDLNAQQYLAATSDARHLRIIAGAGTGKTRTLTYRLAYLLTRGDIYPSQIVAITFTNKAANEMKDRTRKILEDNGMNVGGTPLICTFHSFCVRFLRQELVRHFKGFTNSFAIADDLDQKAVYKKAAAAVTGGRVLSAANMKGAIEIISNYKTKGLSPMELPDHMLADAKYSISIKQLYAKYQELLAQNNLVDFDDLLMFTRDIMEKDPDCAKHWQNRYKAFMVDEFQDTNLLQYELVKLFMNSETGLSVVGDPDQTIYTWRGADSRIIQTMLGEDFKDLVTITLDKNYRSTQAILDKANVLIKKNRNRIDKSLVAASGVKGDAVDFVNSYDSTEDAQTVALRISSFHTAKQIPYSDMAIIIRSNYQSRAFETMFSRMKIPYRLYDAVGFYERQEVKAGLAYLRLLINTGDSVSFEKVLQYPTRSIGDKTLDALYQAANEAQMPVFEYVLNNTENLPVGGKANLGLKSLAANYRSCLDELDAATTPSQMCDAITNYFESTGLFNCVRKMDQDDASKRGDDNENDRENNLKELVTDFKGYLESAVAHPEEDNDPSLNGFLINVALVSAQDDEGDVRSDKVNIMTAHVSKGLEFPVVFVDGLVEGIFPTTHALNAGTGEAIEEERRLLFVALTRAKEHLTVTTYAGTRFGNESNVPSEFLKEIGFTVKSQERGALYSMRSDHNSYRARNKGYNSQYNGTYRRVGSLGLPAEPDANDYGEFTFGGMKKPRDIVRASAPAASITNDVKYAVGDKVAHASFGVGKVIAVHGNKIDVQFADEIGTKTLIIGFKAFKKIS